MYEPTRRERIARARQLHRRRGIPDGWANVIAAAVLAGFLILLLWVASLLDPGASNNITCKGTSGTQYWLCIAGQAQRQYVNYAIWSRARVGGYYDEGRHSVFGDVGEDPAAPHGFLHGLSHDMEHGGFHGDGGDGGR